MCGSFSHPSHDILIFCTCHCIPTTAVPRLTATNVVQKLKGMGGWWRLSRELGISDSTLGDMDQQHSDYRGRMEALIGHWLKIDPYPSWRRLIIALNRAGHHQTADSIRQYAEPLTGMSYTGLAIRFLSAQL